MSQFVFIHACFQLKAMHHSSVDAYHGRLHNNVVRVERKRVLEPEDDAFHNNVTLLLRLVGGWGGGGGVPL